MMGPWLIFATLLNRATIALYEDAPLGPGFGKFVVDARVSILGLVPSMVRAWRASRAMEDWDWSAIRLLSSTGESSQRDDYFYLSWLAGFKPIIEYCGGTEIGGGYISSTVLEPNAPATFTGPTLGLDVEILDEAGHSVAEGELLIVPPSIGLSQSLLHRDHHATYYHGVPRSPSGGVLRRHGDHFRRLPGGFFEAGGRTDDTMNLGGIKVSSLELERAINRVPGVRESAAVACSREGGPDSLVVFLVLDPSSEESNGGSRSAAEALLPPAGEASTTKETLTAGLAGTAREAAARERQWVATLNHAIRQQINPLFKVAEVVIVPQLPRTASNKILRRRLRDQWRQGPSHFPER
jgi:acetyl-CoA synthetase